MAGFDRIVLAAGLATRFGTQKLGVLLHGRPLLHYVLDLAHSDCDRAPIVVTGANRSLSSVIDDWRATRSAELCVTVNETMPPKLSDSLRTGLKHVHAGAEGVLIFLGDMPLVPSGIAAALVRAIREGARAAAPQYHGKRGHPVALSQSLLEDAARVKGDAGAGALLANLGPSLALVDTFQAGVVFDVDRLEDLVKPLMLEI